MYVRVTGGLKSFGSKRYINALHVRPVTDAFEVFFHQLEVITVTLTIERGAVRGISFATRATFDHLYHSQQLPFSLGTRTWS